MRFFVKFSTTNFPCNIYDWDKHQEKSVRLQEKKEFE